MSGMHVVVTRRSLVFVDPGKHGCGVAHWRGGEFRGAWYTKGTRAQFAATIAVLNPEIVVTEIPVSYHITKQKGDQNDLVQVALSAGACMSVCDTALTVTPGEWKGQVPKDIHQKRVMRDFTPEMMRHVMMIDVSVRHNAIDAVALGLWWLTQHR